MHSDHGSVLSAWPLLFHTTGTDPSNQSLQLEVTLSSCSVFFLPFLVSFLGFFLLSSFRSYFESSQFLLLNVLLKCLTPTRSKVLRCWRTLDLTWGSTTNKGMDLFASACPWFGNASDFVHLISGIYLLYTSDWLSWWNRLYWCCLIVEVNGCPFLSFNGVLLKSHVIKPTINSGIDACSQDTCFKILFIYFKYVFNGLFIFSLLFSLSDPSLKSLNLLMSYG